MWNQRSLPRPRAKLRGVGVKEPSGAPRSGAGAAVPSLGTSLLTQGLDPEPLGGRRGWDGVHPKAWQWERPGNSTRTCRRREGAGHSAHRTPLASAAPAPAPRIPLRPVRDAPQPPASPYASRSSPLRPSGEGGAGRGGSGRDCEASVSLSLSFWFSSTANETSRGEEGGFLDANLRQCACPRALGHLPGSARWRRRLAVTPAAPHPRRRAHLRSASR